MSKGHPKGLYLLFTVEMWERFSFYGMRALLFLYMLKCLNFSQEKSGHIYGMYTGLVYLTPLIGGYLADNYLGQRKSILIGGILMAIGHFIMAIQHLPFFYGALALLIIGNGFFKPNISTVVGQLYDKQDPRKDSAFTIFYMGVNLGAFFSPIVCGTLGQKVGWHYGFGAAGVGMVLGLIVYMILQDRYLGDAGKYPVRKAAAKNGHSVDEPLTKEEWMRVAVVFVLTFFCVVFWASFEQAGSSLSVFADVSTDLRIFGWEMPSSWFQAANPFFIFLLAPFFSMMWVKLAEIKKSPSLPVKFGLALIFIALGFALMMVAAKLNANGQKVSYWWLTGLYFIHTIGELCLSPVGLSAVTKLSPAKFVSLLIGVWFLASAPANYIGGMFAGDYDKMNHVTFFAFPVAFAGFAGLLLFILSPKIKKMMGGVE